ncbi:MAG TPA: hypothetical protein VJU81_16125 [Methylomirabilota bacterium]|nr:hypothetical protein [Methylomirabilota bacterium]
MKGLTLAAAAFLLIVVGSALALRVYRGHKEFKVFLAAFAAATLGYVAAYPLTPADLGFLPAGWLEPFTPVDFANGLVALALVFHGFWCFAYFACLSPSMGVMVALRARGARGISAAEALAMQGREEPVNLIFQRRLPKLVEGGYVSEEGGTYRLLPPGERVAALGVFLKRLINADAPLVGSRPC